MRQGVASSRPLRSPRRAGAPQVPSAYSRSTHLLDGASKPPGKPSSARLLEIPYQHFKLQRSEPAEVDDPRRAGRAFSLARPFDRSFAGLLGRGRRSLRDPVRVELFALFGRSVPDLVRVPERLLPVCLDPVPPRFPVRPTPPLRPSRAGRWARWLCSQRVEPRSCEDSAKGKRCATTNP